MFECDFEIPKKDIRDKESYRYKLVQGIGHALLLGEFRIHPGHYKVAIRRLTKKEIAEFQGEQDDEQEN